MIWCNADGALRYAIPAAAATAWQVGVVRLLACREFAN